LAMAEESDRPAAGPGIELTPLSHEYVEVRVDESLTAAFITVHGPSSSMTASVEAMVAAGASWWALAACRQLDDVMLDLRFNRPEIGTWVLRTSGDPAHVLAADDMLREHAGHWLAHEIRLYWQRTLKRLDLSARTIVALVEPGSCFAGTLAELALAADRSYMLDGAWEDDD